jgi:hypothetical protein
MITIKKLRCYGVGVSDTVTGTAEYEATGTSLVKDVESLLSAAPDMLEALKAVLPNIAFITSQDSLWDKYYNMIDEAIQKAEGRAT